MSNKAGEMLAAHLDDVPEPLQTVIRERINNDWIEGKLEELYAEFNLTEEQQHGFWIQAIMIICGVTSLADLKDELIAEANLDYETSVRLQRRFERDVLDPITDEAESRGMEFADSAPDQADSPGGLSGDEPLYADRRNAVLPTLIKRGGATYPVSQISGVTVPFRMPFEFFGGFLLNGGCAVIGVVVIIGGLGAVFSSFGEGIGAILIGAVMAAIGFFNVRGCFNRKWIVAVNLIDQENLHLETDTEEEAHDLYDAIMTVMS